jgi:hypothetical protein
MVFLYLTSSLTRTSVSELSSLHNSDLPCSDPLDVILGRARNNNRNNNNNINDTYYFYAFPVMYMYFFLFR